jgi:hypothetical protein
MPARPAVRVTTDQAARLKRDAINHAAQSAGLLEGQTSRVQARITETLLAAAKARSGITSDTELLEYALARVAIEDDYGAKLLALEGSVPPDVDLEL